MKASVIFTSGFVDDVRFSYYRPSGSMSLLQQYNAQTTTPAVLLLRDVGCMLSQMNFEF